MFELITKMLDLFIHGNKRAIFKLAVVIVFGIIVLPIGLEYFYENINLIKYNIWYHGSLVYLKKI